MRYNPPPNWPAPPPGWTPPPGWRPDPLWPPPPPGWQLWVRGRPGKRAAALVAGGIIAGIIATVTAAVVVIVVAVTPGPKPSDEQQIRAVVAGMQEAWNRSDFDAFRGYLCKGNQWFWSTIGDSGSAAMTMRQRGRAQFTVNSVQVAGDSAKASVKESYSNGAQPPETTEDFVHEDGKWKVCEPNLMNEAVPQRLPRT
jgi:hypothetical protein